MQLSTAIMHYPAHRSNRVQPANAHTHLIYVMSCAKAHNCSNRTRAWPCAAAPLHANWPQLRLCADRMPRVHDSI